jgi:osmotically-inducible protein OsmY
MLPSPLDQNGVVTETAEACLRKSPYLAIRSISVKCERGILILQGQVPRYHQKQLAQEAVSKIDCVVQIVNEIEVVN